MTWNDPAQDVVSFCGTERRRSRHHRALMTQPSCA